jgi:hypothetical protein
LLPDVPGVRPGKSECHSRRQCAGWGCVGAKAVCCGKLPFVTVCGCQPGHDALPGVRRTHRSPFQAGEQAVGWTSAPHARLTAKASPWHRHPPEEGSDHPTCCSFQSARLFSTVRTGQLLIFKLPDGLFQGLAHRLVACFLNLLLHCTQGCACT